MIAAFAIMAIVAATAAGALALRLSGVMQARDRAIASRLEAAAAISAAQEDAALVAEELVRYKAITAGQRSALVADIERLENDLENCSAPGVMRQRLRALALKAQETRAAPTSNLH